mmetsp:Transcript_60011/g.89133  ORF Transcript_60011/g.89133 Transcript_60011/m.89133 type:complete len:110 (+) Transcript_60011:360-689(+)
MALMVGWHCYGLRSVQQTVYWHALHFSLQLIVQNSLSHMKLSNMSSNKAQVKMDGLTFFFSKLGNKWQCAQSRKKQTIYAECAMVYMEHYARQQTNLPSLNLHCYYIFT